MEFLELVRARHSVRTYSGEAVEDAKIEKILEAARLAPSWANKQCWSFVVVKDREKLKTLAKAAGVTSRWVADAPVIIVGCGDPRRSGSREGIEYYTVDVAIAMEHLVLAAAEQGLGTCWIGYFDEKAAKKALGIPDRIRVVAMTPVGYPAEKMSLRERLSRWVAKAKNRSDLGKIVHYETW